MSTPTPEIAASHSSGTDALVARAYQLSRDGVTSAAVDSLLSAGGEHRQNLEAARDQVAARVRARVDDFEATAALQLLNRTLSRAPIHDPLDWKVRWGQRFRRP